MNDFKWKHFQGDIILGCVRWYCKYGISYRDLEEMMLERGVEVDHTTLFRWVQQYAPEIEKRLRWYQKPRLGESWKVDESQRQVEIFVPGDHEKRKNIGFLLIFYKECQSCQAFFRQNTA